MELTKTKQIFFILEEAHKRKDRTIDSYDEILKEKFGLSSKQIGRLLKEISGCIDTFMEIKVGKRIAYKLVKTLDIFTTIFENSEEIQYLIHMAHDADPEVFQGLEALTKKDTHVYLFKSSPFEDIKTLEAKETFKELRDAVSGKEYRKIMYSESSHEVKCLKIVYMENNWYLAYVDDKDKVKLGRINAIKKVQKTNNKKSFLLKNVEKHLTFLKTMQNPMTLDKESKIAYIRVVTKKKRKYFKEDMKLLMPSQKFVEIRDDGSIVFSVEYTQYMEILPFLYKWIPHFEILGPDELKEEYEKNLKKALGI